MTSVVNANKIKGLYIVATPIGNLLDISQRALNILEQVDVIAAEDTRHSGKLLAYHGIKTSMIAYHQHNEASQLKQLINKLHQGASIALISDAGTPLISDPGYLLVQAAKQESIPVIPIPGACAFITALCASGLPSDHFRFEGFLPAKSSARQKQLIALKQETATLIFYEAPHRIIALVSDIAAIFSSDRQIVLARELTKQFEQIHTCSLGGALEWLTSDDYHQKGEFVVILSGAQAIEIDKQQEQAITTLKILLEELPLKQAVALASKISQYNKNKLYQVALSLPRS